jgi:hypothetical protein
VEQQSDVYIQNINFALLGLVAPGVGPSEESALPLQKLLFAARIRTAAGASIARRATRWPRARRSTR